MPFVDAKGVKLYYEEAGTGLPIIFVHEMTGDHRIWEPQMRHFSRNYRCIAYAARGYTPSEVPKDPSAYSQAQAADDIALVMDGLGLERAHVVGLSMGGYAAIHFGIRHTARARSLVVAGCGHGSAREAQQIWQEQAQAMAAKLRLEGMKPVAEAYAHSAYRVQFRDKDPRGWKEWADRLAGQSAEGLAMSISEVQGKRPSVLDMEHDVRRLLCPVLLVVGDEDEPVLEINLYLKRTLPMSGLVVIPKTGHAVNSEEPERFNREVSDFFHRVELGRWTARNKDAVHTEIWLAQRD